MKGYESTEALRPNLSGGLFGNNRRFLALVDGLLFPSTTCYPSPAALYVLARTRR